MKERALQALSSFIDRIPSKNAKLLSYWILDYVRILSHEGKSKTFRRYSRGDVIKVHLGYRIGSEEGGLHFAVVINNNDSIKNPVVTVIPLTSLKRPQQVEKLKPGNVFLGSTLQQMLFKKAMAMPSAALDKELSKIKWGSIALANQIVTVSKLRIYDPVRGSDSLNGIRFDAETLDEIDKGISELFLYRP